MDVFLIVIELVGTAAFAVSGALTGVKKEMDVLGVVILGLVTAVGGGFLRDLTLGITPPGTFQDPTCALVAIAVSLLVFVVCCWPKLQHGQRIFEKSLLFMDSIGLGIFTVNGILIALDCSAGYRKMLLIFVGVLTGVGGGVLRDILAGDRPYIFIKHIYACASVFGAAAYLFSRGFLAPVQAVCLSICVTVAIRLLSSHYNWNLPKAPLPRHPAPKGDVPESGGGQAGGST